MPKTGVVYCRISKDDRGDALGVARQERLCRELAERKGITVIDVLVDNDLSAYSKTTRRPAFTALLDKLHAGTVDALLVYHVDRLYRRTADLERIVEILEHADAKVLTVAAGDIDLASASGRMIARILGVVAQGEVERLSERTKAKLAELAAQGAAPGGRPPFGYRRTPGSYEIDPAEERVLRLMADRVLSGVALRQVAREMKALGHPPRHAETWHQTHVRNVLINPAVAGLRVHQRKVAGEGNWEPIFDRATWDTLRVTLTWPGRKRPQGGRPEYLLTGFAFTPSGEALGGKDGRYATRRSGVEAKGPGVSVNAAALDEWVETKVYERLAVSSIVADDDIGDDDDVAAVEAELAAVADLHGKGVISMAEWLAARSPLTARLEDARRRGAVGRIVGEVPVADLWADYTVGEKRETLALVVDRVVVGTATRGRWSPIEERMTADGCGIVWTV